MSLTESRNIYSSTNGTVPIPRSVSKNSNLGCSLLQCPLSFRMRALLVAELVLQHSSHPALEELYLYVRHANTASAQQTQKTFVLHTRAIVPNAFRYLTSAPRFRYFRSYRVIQIECPFQICRHDYKIIEDVCKSH